MRLLLASNNALKRHELERVLAGLGVTVLTPQELGLDLVPEESGATFAANSLLKARAFAARCAGPVLADDSGLEVDALGGEPGVRSARFAGPGAGDAAHRALLLARLRDVPEERRGARFVCVLTLARGDRVLAVVRGEAEGRIATAERGAGGFGYDPLFIDGASGRTFAELSAAEKDAVSHRGRALRALRSNIEEHQATW